MTRDQFIKTRRNDWRRFEILLTEAGEHRVPKLNGNELAELSALYRALCFDLSMVQSRDWGTSMSRYLNGLVARGHNCLYQSEPGSFLAVVRFVTTDFPQLFRANLSYFLAALFFFAVPFLVSGVAVAIEPSLASRIMPNSYQSMFDSMYSESPSAEASGNQSVMAGFYVKNNVGISFRCFALGAFAGIGTIVVLMYNGIFLGTVTGFLVARGHSENFFGFVIGHGSFELTAIVISGAAGLIIGDAMVRPGQKSRVDALRERGLVAVKIALGAAVMLCIAALIEGFWSPSLAPTNVKMIVGGLLWVVVVLYLGLAGRTKLVQDATPLPKVPTE